MINMRTGMRFITKEAHIESLPLKAISKAPTIMRKMVPGPSSEEMNMPPWYTMYSNEIFSFFLEEKSTC